MSELRAFLDGVPVGSFAMSATGATTLTYDDDYRSGPAATPLSLSMRTSRSTWKAASAGPWLAGLLPDAIGERQFRDLAKSFDITQDEATDRYRRITSGVAEAFSEAARGVAEPFARELADAVAANAARRGW